MHHIYPNSLHLTGRSWGFVGALQKAQKAFNRLCASNYAHKQHTVVFCTAIYVTNFALNNLHYNSYGAPKLADPRVSKIMI